MIDLRLVEISFKFVLYIITAFVFAKRTITTAIQSVETQIMYLEINCSLSRFFEIE